MTSGAFNWPQNSRFDPKISFIQKIMTPDELSTVYLTPNDLKIKNLPPKFRFIISFYRKIAILWFSCFLWIIKNYAKVSISDCNFALPVWQDCEASWVALEFRIRDFQVPTDRRRDSLELHPKSRLRFEALKIVLTRFKTLKNRTRSNRSFVDVAVIGRLVQLGHEFVVRALFFRFRRPHFRIAKFRLRVWQFFAKPTVFGD